MMGGFFRNHYQYLLAGITVYLLVGN